MTTVMPLDTSIKVAYYLLTYFDTVLFHSASVLTTDPHLSLTLIHTI